MSFATEAQHKAFLENCPLVEKYAIDAGIIIINPFDFSHPSK